MRITRKKFANTPSIKNTLRTFSKLAEISQAIKKVENNTRLYIGGFGLCGKPSSLLSALSEQPVKDLEVVISPSDRQDLDLGLLLSHGLVSKVVTSYIGSSKICASLFLKGDFELELMPQGTFAEKMRAYGKGIPAFWTPTGVGTLVEKGGIPMKYNKKGEVVRESNPKPTRSFNGKLCLLEQAMGGGVAFVKAHKADSYGNLSYRKSAGNYNSDMALAADFVIAEVEKILPEGEALDPEHIDTPGIFVDMVVQTQEKNKSFERLRFKEDSFSNTDFHNINKKKIAQRLAKEIKKGWYVNLGIGIPDMVPSFIDEEIEHTIQSENGTLGVAGYPSKGEEDADLVNAGKETVTVFKDASFFSSSDSFGMIRGGHLNCTILGSLQVSATGDLSNWMIPGKLVKGMGGAMDLVSSGSKVFVGMEHLTKKNELKIFEKNTFPLTGQNCVDLLVTEKAVFSFDTGRIKLIEIAAGESVDSIREATGCAFEVAEKLKFF